MGKEKKCGQQRLRRKGQRVSMCVPESKGRKNFKEKSGGRSCQCPHMVIGVCVIKRRAEKKSLTTWWWAHYSWALKSGLWRVGAEWNNARESVEGDEDMVAQCRPFVQEICHKWREKGSELKRWIRWRKNFLLKRGRREWSQGDIWWNKTLEEIEGEKLKWREESQGVHI